MPPAGSPSSIPCRQGREIAVRVLPSLSHVARSGVSEPLADPVRLSPVIMSPCLLSVPFPTQGPFRSAGITPRLRYYGPIRHPCRPGLPLAGSRSPRARHRQGFPCCCAFHLPCMPTPLPRQKPDRCARRSLPNPVGGLPLITGGSASALTVSGPARRSLAFRPAWSLSRPRRPRSRQSASIHVVTSMNRPGRYQPERQLLGGFPHNTRKARLSTAHCNAELTSRSHLSPDYS